MPPVHAELYCVLTLPDADCCCTSCAGKTQSINHYLVNRSWYLVDCPGYGEALLLLLLLLLCVIVAKLMPKA
jgi:hypothetical protein